MEQVHSNPGNSPPHAPKCLPVQPSTKTYPSAGPPNMLQQTSQHLKLRGESTGTDFPSQTRVRSQVAFVYSEATTSAAIHEQPSTSMRYSTQYTTW